MVKEFIRDMGPFFAVCAVAMGAMLSLYTVTEQETAKRNANVTWTLEDKSGPIAYGLSHAACMDLMFLKAASNGASIGCRMEAVTPFTRFEGN